VYLPELHAAIGSSHSIWPTRLKLSVCTGEPRFGENEPNYSCSVHHWLGDLSQATDRLEQLGMLDVLSCKAFLAIMKIIPNKLEDLFWKP
jgi:hypothetical protein